jgi:hypothetical protein
VTFPVRAMIGRCRTPPRILEGLNAAQIAGVTHEAGPLLGGGGRDRQAPGRPPGSGYADFAVLVRANNDADPFRRDLRSLPWKAVVTYRP